MLILKKYDNSVYLNSNVYLLILDKKNQNNNQNNKINYIFNYKIKIIRNFIFLLSVLYNNNYYSVIKFSNLSFNTMFKKSIINYLNEDFSNFFQN